MVCTDAGKTTEAKLLQSLNANSSMVCNASGKASEAKLRHPRNACASMVCNASGKVTEAKLLHPENANDVMVVTPVSMLTFSISVLFLKSSEVLALIVSVFVATSQT